jgi:aspartate aminotransferase
MPQPSLRALSLQESAIRKLDAIVAARSGVHFHRINIGQPDVATPAPLLEAIAGFQPEVIAYGPASGLLDCRESAARYHARWCPSLRPEHVAVTTGGSEALLFAFTAICDPGDDILVPEPYYTNYNGFSTVAGTRIRPVPARLEDGFALPDNATLDEACGPRTRAILFSNPGNPTGAIYGRADLERVVEWARSRGLFVIADEVYRQIWFDRAPTSVLELDDSKEHVICIDSMSKTYSACGLRLGFLISRNPLLMEKVERLGQARLGAQPLAQAVASAAFSLPEEYYASIRRIYSKRIDTLLDALDPIPGVFAPRPGGAFYLMLKLPVDDSEKFGRYLAAEFEYEGESVVVAPGPGFYSDPSLGRDQVRLAAVLEESRLRRAAELLRLAIERYPGRTS